MNRTPAKVWRFIIAALGTYPLISTSDCKAEVLRMTDSITEAATEGSKHNRDTQHMPGLYWPSKLLCLPLAGTFCWVNASIAVGNDVRKTTVPDTKKYSVGERGKPILHMRLEDRELIRLERWFPVM